MQFDELAKGIRSIEITFPTSGHNERVYINMDINPKALGSIKLQAQKIERMPDGKKFLDFLKSNENQFKLYSQDSGWQLAATLHELGAKNNDRLRDGNLIAAVRHINIKSGLTSQAEFYKNGLCNDPAPNTPAVQYFDESGEFLAAQSWHAGEPHHKLTDNELQSLNNPNKAGQINAHTLLDPS